MKTAMVLSGGGAYGAFEVGVVKALEQRGVRAEIFTGASVGSFNAAMMITSDGAALERVWNEKVAEHDGGNGVYRLRGPVRYVEIGLESPARALMESARDAAFFTRDWTRRFAEFATSRGGIPRRALSLVDLSAFLSVEPLRKLLDDTLDLAAIRSSAKQLRVIATNWRSGELKVFHNEDMTDAHGCSIVMGSAAIPGVFPPVEIAGEIYVDGGVVMNTPLTSALEAGATELHVIYLDPDVSTVPIGETPNTLDTFSRAYQILLATMIEEDIETARWINQGLDVVDRAAAGAEPESEDAKRFLRVASQISARIENGSPYRRLTIHRYNPAEDLGGMLGMLDFRPEKIRRMIERGLEAVLRHDCATSRCLLPHSAAALA
jgi:predicted acylesterase/phospholipase RssA